MWRLIPVVLAAVAAAAAIAGSGAATSPTEVSIYATGLFNPKGMTFGADGSLYVAESGPPGDVEVPLPVNFGGSGPIGTRAAIAKIPPGGGPTEQWVTGLPNIGLYGGVEMLGAASVTVSDGQLYEVAAGHMTISPKLSRVTPEGEMITIADVGAFNDENPPPRENADAVPMGNPYDLVGIDDRLYISDGNYNRIIEAVPATGELRLLAEFLPGPVTVGMAVGPDDNIYAAQYGNAPYLPGSARIDKITPAGEVTEGVVKGLTTAIDVAFAPDGTMYVLQYAAKFNAQKLRYIENTGGLFRIGKDGSKEPILTGLMFPTALEFGPDGALYVTNFGNEANFGEGQVLRVVPGGTSVVAPKVPDPRVHGSYDIPSANPTVAGDLTGAAKLTIIEPADTLKWGYAPATLKVKTGQKIVVTNLGRIPHTATSSTGVFDTGLIGHNKSAVIEIDDPGNYPYICSPHPWMKGTILVSGTSTATGTATESAAPEVDPPSLNVVAVVGTVGLIVVGVFGLAWLARRRPDS